MATSVRAADLENTLYLDLTYGRVVIELRPDLAPNHVARIKELAREGFYDGIAFHRVIAGFMAQTGDPDGHRQRWLRPEPQGRVLEEPHVRGTVSMARAQRSRQRRQPVLHLLRRRHDSSTASIRSGARWSTAWSSSTRSTKAPEADNGVVPEAERDKIVKLQVAADAQ